MIDWLIDCHLLFVPLYLTTELETSLGRPKRTLSGDFGSREIRVKSFWNIILIT